MCLGVYSEEKTPVSVIYLLLSRICINVTTFLCFAANITLKGISDSIYIQDKLLNYLTRKIKSAFARESPKVICPDTIQYCSWQKRISSACQKGVIKQFTGKFQHLIFS